MCRRQAKILNVLNYLSDCLSYAFQLLKLRTSSKVHISLAGYLSKASNAEVILRSEGQTSV